MHIDFRYGGSAANNYDNHVFDGVTKLRGEGANGGGK